MPETPPPSPGPHDDVTAELERLRDRIREQEAQIRQRDAHLGVLAFEAATRRGQLLLARLEQESEAERIGPKLNRRVRRRLDRMAPQGTRRRRFAILFGHGLDVALEEGWLRAIGRALAVWRWVPALRWRGWSLEDRPPRDPAAPLTFEEQYAIWRWANEPTSDELRAMRKASEELAFQPLISIVMPVFDPPPELLREAIDSVRNQAYPRWELCIADDRSRRRDVRAMLRRAARSDRRIRLVRLDRNRGISAASNAALALASGQFVGFLDHDDELRPHALFEVVRLLNEQPDLDLIYTDEDKKRPDGTYTQPLFKPGWSPDLLLSHNYVLHFTTYRREAIDRVGGLREGYEEAQDYDLVLRVSEITDRIQHLPKPLYSWRMAPASGAEDPMRKTGGVEAGERALRDALERRRVRGSVERDRIPARYRVRLAISGEPRVAIVIPTRDEVAMLRRCIESIRRRTSYDRYEIVVVDNQSRDPETLAYLASHDGRVVPYDAPFNYSRMMNEAAGELDHDVLLFLNNDTTVINPDWLESMLEHAQRPEVGVVGARLFHGDGRAQHEGVMLGLVGGIAINIDFQGVYGLGDVVRNCSAVTGACMMTRRDVFSELGGFEERLVVGFNDVDYCLRAREKGYEVLYTPYARLFHLQGASRGAWHPDSDNDVFRERWGDLTDPYYNPNLDPHHLFWITMEAPEEVRGR